MFQLTNIKNAFCSLNIRTVNLSLNLFLNELTLIAEHRNMSDYENKSTRYLIKALRGTIPKLGINKSKLKEIKKDFYNLRHEFSKEEADKYRKMFYDIKNYRYLSELEIEKIRKNVNGLEKSLNLKKPRDDIDSVYYEDLDEDEDLDKYADDDKYKKIGSVRRLFKGFDSDYYEPVVIDRGFDERDHYYIKYRSNGDKHENLSPEQYLNMIRPYLRDLINEHKPIEELNNNNNNNNNNNDTDCGE